MTIEWVNGVESLLKSLDSGRRMDLNDSLLLLHAIRACVGRLLLLVWLFFLGLWSQKMEDAEAAHCGQTQFRKEVQMPVTPPEVKRTVCGN